jgi:hypothetical protein
VVFYCVGLFLGGFVAFVIVLFCCVFFEVFLLGLFWCVVQRKRFLDLYTKKSAEAGAEEENS